jgi:hypothetical protein
MISTIKSSAAMKRPNLILILLILILYSCHNNEVKLLENGPKFAINKGKKEVVDFGDTNNNAGVSGGDAGMKTGALNSKLNLASNANGMSYGKKAEQAVIVEDLPRSYKKRDFMNNISDASYDIFTIPGNIVRWNAKDSVFEFKTLKAIIKGNKPPLAATISDGQIYSAKINSNTSFNGTYLIGGLNVSKDQIMELNIQDATKSLVPDSLIDVDVIKQIAESLPADDRKNYFYVKGAILTLIDNRKYTESKFDASINSCFVTAGGKTYSSNEKFQRERVISILKVSLDNLISAH